VDAERAVTPRARRARAACGRPAAYVRAVPTRVRLHDPSPAGSRPWRLGGAVLVCVLLARPASLRAQAGGPGAAGPAPVGGFGGLRGVVYDSVLRRPLAGAAVFVDGTPRAAVSDSLGRFTLDTVPAGASAVAVTHPALQALGLDEVTAPIALHLGGTVDVVLATPSRQTLWARLCTGEHPADDVGAVFGEVRDARTGDRLAGARTAAAWTAVDRAGRRVPEGRGAAAAETDAAGAYRLCGVPARSAVSLDAAAGALDSARALVVVGESPFARVDLWVRGADVAAADVPGAGRAGAPPEPRGTAVLVGVVCDTAGVPRPGARVTVDGSRGPAWRPTRAGASAWRTCRRARGRWWCARRASRRAW
jgi:hypothetical protein